MKILRCFFAAVLVCGLASMAKAEDFKFQVLDPIPNENPISGPFALTFEACPSGVYGAYDGCFFGYNNTFETFTSLHITFPDTGGIVGQTVTCGVDDPLSLFPEETCTAPSAGDDDFTLDLYGGSGIGSGVAFVFVENGVAFADFPTGQASFSVTPEPGSIVMLSSGAAMLGLLLVMRRRRSANDPLL